MGTLLKSLEFAPLGINCHVGEIKPYFCRALFSYVKSSNCLENESVR